MTRTIPAALLTKIKGGNAALCTIATITRRDGVILRLTDLDTDLPVGGFTYIASEGYDRKSIEHRAGTKVDETEMTALFGSSQINVQDLANGLYSYADVLLEAIDFTDISLGKFILTRGRVGKIVRGDTGGFKFDLRSVTERLIGKLGRTVTPECLWSVGDDRCRIPILPKVDLRNTAYILGDFVRAVVVGGDDFEVFGNIIFEATTAGTTGGSSPSWNLTLGGSTSDGIRLETSNPVNSTIVNDCSLGEAVCRSPPPFDLARADKLPEATRVAIMHTDSARESLRIMGISS